MLILNFIMLVATATIALPSIDEVAKNNIKELPVSLEFTPPNSAENTKPIRSFYLTLAPNEVLHDHSTGQRLLVTLSPLLVKRVAEPTANPIKLGSGSALYLENTESGAIQNIAKHPIVYLVVQAADEIIDTQFSPCSAPYKVINQTTRSQLCQIPRVEVHNQHISPNDLSLHLSLNDNMYSYMINVQNKPWLKWQFTTK